MDSITSQYQAIIERVLSDYADFLGHDDEVQIACVFDRERQHFLVIESGWHEGYRLYGTLLHIHIHDGKVWIEHDGTEEGIAYEFVAAGIPQSHLVLAFKSVERRKVTEFAVS